MTLQSQTQNVDSGTQSKISPLEAYALERHEKKKAFTERFFRMEQELKALREKHPSLNLDFLYDKCFAGLAKDELESKYDREDLPYWKTTAVMQLQELADNGEILVSDELKEYLLNKERHYKYAESASKARRFNPNINPVEALNDKLRALVAECIKNAVPDLEYDDSDIRAVITNISERCREGSKFSGFARIVARNWAIDRKRGIESEPRIAAQNAEKSRRETIEREELDKRQKNYDAAKKEAIEIIAQLSLRYVGENNQSMKHLGIVLFTFFYGETDEQLEARYPGTNRALRYKWRERGKKILFERASENLRFFLNLNTSSPQFPGLTR